MPCGRGAPSDFFAWLCLTTRTRLARARLGLPATTQECSFATVYHSLYATVAYPARHTPCRVCIGRGAERSGSVRGVTCVHVSVYVCRGAVYVYIRRLSSLPRPCTLRHGKPCEPGGRERSPRSEQGGVGGVPRAPGVRESSFMLSLDLICVPPLAKVI